MQWDGTFRLMKKTMNDPESDAPNTVAILVLYASHLHLPKVKPMRISRD